MHHYQHPYIAKGLTDPLKQITFLFGTGTLQILGNSLVVANPARGSKCPPTDLRPVFI
jgi:hypothetical protein